MYGAAFKAPSTDDETAGNVQGCCCLIKVGRGTVGCRRLWCVCDLPAVDKIPQFDPITLERLALLIEQIHAGLELLQISLVLFLAKVVGIFCPICYLGKPIKVICTAGNDMDTFVMRTNTDEYFRRQSASIV